VAKAKPGPETHPDRPGAPHTENQTGRQHLSEFRFVAREHVGEGGGRGCIVGPPPRQHTQKGEAHYDNCNNDNCKIKENDASDEKTTEQRKRTMHGLDGSDCI
jgi:hypothetical protein